MSEDETFYTTINGIIFSLLAAISLVIIVILLITWLSIPLWPLYAIAWGLFIAFISIALLIFAKIALMRTLESGLRDIPCPKCHHEALKLHDFSSIKCNECDHVFKPEEIEKIIISD